MKPTYVEISQMYAAGQFYVRMVFGQTARVRSAKFDTYAEALAWVVAQEDA